MIPKIIHYCWFGGNPLPEFAVKCIESWKKHLPDYKIMRWDESNYDITKCQYMADAYKEKKWAFVSDYCRIDVVNQYGGIYLDTDVEVLKSFDPLLNEKMFCCFEIQDPVQLRFNMPIVHSVNFGLGFGSVSNHPVLNELITQYHTLSFYNPDGTLNMEPCPIYQTSALEKFGLKKTGDTQRLDSAMVFSPEYLCPQSNITDKMLCLTENTYSIHHYTATWHKDRFKAKLRNFFLRYTNFYVADKMACIINYPVKIYNKLLCH